MAIDLRSYGRCSSGPEESLTWSLQALLIRHETYVAGAELERTRVNASLIRLETQSRHLESENCRLSDENKSLAQQVEGLNSALIDSDQQVTLMTQSYTSTQEELQRVSSLAARAQDLELQLIELETEQATLQTTLVTTQEQERLTQRKFRDSQRRLIDLSAQFESIEQESHEERKHHAEVIERMKRTQAVEEELQTNITRSQTLADVVPNQAIAGLVKDLMQENANMVVSEKEMKKMLDQSNEEIALLRSQLAETLPSDPVYLSDQARSRDLNQELASNEAQISSELHVHHHYHAPPAASSSQSRTRAPTLPKQRRKKSLTAPTRQTPSEAMLFTRSRMTRPSSTSSSFGYPESRTMPNRWSNLSTQTRSSLAISSGPSSPHSTVFEHSFDDYESESSRPTSPESSGLWSPQQSHSQKTSEDIPVLMLSQQQHRASSAPSSGPVFPQTFMHRRTSTQDTEGVDRRESSLPRIYEESPTPEKPASKPPIICLKRTTSHSSLMSVSGMDIHSSIQAPPAFLMPGSLRHKASLTFQQMGPVLTPTVAEVGRTCTSGGGVPFVGQALRDLGGKGMNKDASQTYNPLRDTLPILGGWFTRKTEATVNDTRGDDGSINSDGLSVKSADSEQRPMKKPPTSVPKPRPSLSRTPGINQMGAIPFDVRLLRRKPFVKRLDSDALRDCLVEEHEGETSLADSQADARLINIDTKT